MWRYNYHGAIKCALLLLRFWPCRQLACRPALIKAQIRVKITDSINFAESQHCVIQVWDKQHMIKTAYRKAGMAFGRSTADTSVEEPGVQRCSPWKGRKAAAGSCQPVNGAALASTSELV